MTNQSGHFRAPWPVELQQFTRRTTLTLAAPQRGNGFPQAARDGAVRSILILALLLLVAVASSPAAAVQFLNTNENVIVSDYMRVPPPEDIQGLTQLATTHDLLILHEWSAEKLPLLRSVNPDIVILLYKNRGFHPRNDVESVGLYEDYSHIDSMFMHDSSGNHVHWDWDNSGSIDGYATRPEDPTFRQIWTDLALQQVQAGGWDGVFIDDCWTTLTPYNNMNTPVEYANAAQLIDATAGYLAYVHDAFSAQGLIVGCNVGWWRQATSTGGRAGRLYLSNCDLGMQEKFFVNYTSYWEDGNGWINEVRAFQEDIRSTDGTLYCYARGLQGDTENMLYALGTSLCINDFDGRVAFDYANDREGGRDPLYYDEYATVENLGPPIADVQWNSSANVGYREFLNGTVVVNPFSSSSTVTSFNGWTDLYGTTAGSSYSLPGHSAMAFFNPSGGSNAPIIAAIGDTTINAGSPYTGPTPSLSAGATPVTWSLQVGPSGMTINSSGVVSWSNPGTTGSPHTVTIRATNSAGSDDESWTITVQAGSGPVAPVVTDIPNQTAYEGQSFTGPTPSLIEGTGPITWTLEAGPAGMTINPSTGVVSWSAPAAAGSPHFIINQAQNPVGFDQDSWELFVAVADGGVVDLTAWEFAPELVTPFGTGPNAFPGDSLTAAKTPDDDGDGSGNDLLIGTSSMGTGQAFAHWDSPPNLIDYNADSTYRISFTVTATGFPSPQNIPQIRFRAGYGFTGGLGSMALVVPEGGDVSPTVGGQTTYQLYFDELDVATANGVATVNLGTTFDGMQSNENFKRLFFDWVDFEGGDEPLGGGVIELESVMIERFDRDTLLAPSFVQRIIPGFTQGASVDLFGSPIDTSPGSNMTVTFNTDNAVITSTGTNSPGSISLFGSIPLALDLAGVAVIPFTPYEPTQSRVHWTQIETSSINGDPHVPPMRAMINAFDSARGVNTIASEAHINAARGGLEGDGSANPALNRNVFSAYLALPSNNSTYSGTVGDKLQASLSLLDQDIPYVGAGSVTIDRIRIGSFPADVMP